MKKIVFSLFCLLLFTAPVFAGGNDVDPNLKIIYAEGIAVESLLVTGQNPASSTAAARAVLELLG